MTRRDLAVGGLGTALLALAGCNPFPATCRMRLTLELATPQGQRTGSSVIQVRAREIVHFAGSNRFRRDDRGEAVVIPIGDDVIFGVLEEGIGIPLIWASLPEVESGGDLLTEIRRVNAKASTEPTYDLPEEDWPSLVRFADRSVPESIKPVCMNLHPNQKDREKLRGPCSIRIVRATVTPTRDAVTTGVLRYLPWLTTRHGSMVGGLQYTHTPEQKYNSRRFLRDPS